MMATVTANQIATISGRDLHDGSGHGRNGEHRQTEEQEYFSGARQGCRERLAQGEPCGRTVDEVGEQHRNVHDNQDEQKLRAQEITAPNRSNQPILRDSGQHIELHGGCDQRGYRDKYPD